MRGKMRRSVDEICNYMIQKNYLFFGIHGSSRFIHEIRFFPVDAFLYKFFIFLFISLILKNKNIYERGCRS